MTPIYNVLIVAAVVFMHYQAARLVWTVGVTLFE